MKDSVHATGETHKRFDKFREEGWNIRSRVVCVVDVHVVFASFALSIVIKQIKERDPFPRFVVNLVYSVIYF